MKRFVAILLYFTALLPNRSGAQNNMPSYFEVAKKFFTTYSHNRENDYDRVFFAKKKQGWYTQVINVQNNDSIKSDQLFWDKNGKNYKPLNGFGAGISEEEATEKITEALQSYDPPFVYGFERCIYFGYNGWDADIIKDFGNSIPANDTLLEGLARAYSFYAGRYKGYKQGGQPLDNDPLKSKLTRLEIPGKERVTQFMLYTNKAIDCYRILAQRSPGYRLLVGSPEMKMINEQFYQYQELRIFGYDKEAMEVLNTVSSNSIYQQIGRTYLDACLPNSILITFGDNDTYPLWYVQQKEGFRKDVTVLNYSMLSTFSYLNMLKKNNEISLFQVPDVLKKMKYEYAMYFDEPGQPAEISVPLKRFINELLTSKYTRIIGADSIDVYKTKLVTLNVDLNRIKKMVNQSNFTLVMNFELTDYLYVSDLAIFDILNTYLYTRPVYLTSQVIIPSKYLQHEGSVYRVLPLDEELADKKAKIEIAKIEAFLNKNKPVMVPFGKKLEYPEEMINGLHSFLYGTVINHYTNLKDTVKARQWGTKYLSIPDIKKIEPTVSQLKVYDGLIKVGYGNEVKPFIETLAIKVTENYVNYSALEPYQTLEGLKQYLEYFKFLLGQKGITSEILEKLNEAAENPSLFEGGDAFFKPLKEKITD